MALAGVKAPTAYSRPLAQGHTISELVGHLTFWQNAVTLRLDGHVAKATGASNFPAIEASEAAWKKQLLDLRASQDQLLQRMVRVRPAELARQVPGKRFTTGFMLAGVAHHALYHAGQISMLKRAIERAYQK
jgi:uncharacterized damage-inducible protein DinB